MKIWTFLDDSNLIRGSQSSPGRIPNFQGAADAGLNLQRTPRMAKIPNHLCSLDSIQREVRENVHKDVKF